MHNGGKIVIFTNHGKNNTFTIKDGRKLRFLMELLKQFDFVEIEKSSSKSKISDKKHDLFASAGMWKNREINSEELRKRAWKKAS